MHEFPNTDTWNEYVNKLIVETDEMAKREYKWEIIDNSECVESDRIEWETEKECSSV